MTANTCICIGTIVFSIIFSLFYAPHPPSILIPYRMYLLGYFHLSRNKRPRSSSISCTKEQLLGYVVHICLILFYMKGNLHDILKKKVNIAEIPHMTDHYIVYFNIIKFSQPKPKSRKITKTSI